MISQIKVVLKKDKYIEKIHEYDKYIYLSNKKENVIQYFFVFYIAF